MSVKNRIKKFLEVENLTISSFEKMLNSANGYVNSISKSIGVDKIEILLDKFPNLNIEWLLTGKGSMYKEKNITPELIQLLEERAAMIELQKKYIKILEDQLLENNKYLESPIILRDASESQSKLKK